MATIQKSWADDDDVSPSSTEVIQNDDGTKTVISYKTNDDGKKVKVTQRVKTITTREKVDHNVAERKKWAKYGAEKGQGAGPNTNTTSVEPGFQFKLQTPAQTKKTEPEPIPEPTADAKILCRICSGVHFTSRCPYKDTLGAPEEEKSATAVATGAAGEASATPAAAAVAGVKPGKYVSPHLRAGAQPRQPQDRSDTENTTLRVSNLSEDVYDEDLRGLFSKFGKVVRCHVVKDRETQRPRGFAFVSFDNVKDAEAACGRLDGFGLDNLIMRVEFSKR